MRAAGVWRSGPGDRPPSETLDALVALLRADDPVANDAVRDAGRWLGVALSSVINVVDVPCVVLGGSYAALEPWLVAALGAELDRRVVSAAWSPVRIRASTLGAAAAVRGAGAATVHAILADPDAYLAALTA